MISSLYGREPTFLAVFPAQLPDRVYAAQRVHFDGVSADVDGAKEGDVFIVSDYYIQKLGTSYLTFHSI